MPSEKSGCERISDAPGVDFMWQNMKNSSLKTTFAAHRYYVNMLLSKTPFWILMF